MYKWLFALLAAGTLFAAQRKVFVEVFTETQCPYCPYSSYGLDTLEMNYGDSIVVMKNHPSSSDPFRNNDAITRAYYYPDFAGYPTAYFDGLTKVEGGWNGVYSSYRDAYMQRIDSASPLQINIILSYRSDTRKATAIVSVYAENDMPSGTRIRYAVVEDSIKYHWESRDILRYVQREMLPNADGKVLNISAGQTFVDTVDFAVDTSWVEPNVYFIAFVQNDNTREVYQAEKSRVQVDYGHLAVTDFTYTDSTGNNNGRFEPGDTVVFKMRITDVAPYDTARHAYIWFNTDDPDVSVIDNSFTYSLIPVGSSVDILARACATKLTRPHTVPFFVSMYCDNGKFQEVDTFYIKVGVDSLLVLDDTKNKLLKNYIVPYLDSLNVHYDYQCEQDSGLPIMYPNYKYLVYFTGSDSACVDSAEMALLENFLDNGGRLFATGQNIGQSTAGSAFLNDYLRANFVSSGISSIRVIGAGNVVGYDSMYLTGQGSAMNQYSKDVIMPISPAVPVFYYTTGDSVAAIAYADSVKRVVYFAFGFEGFGPGTVKKQEILRRVLNYLGYSISDVHENNIQIDDAPAAAIFRGKVILNVPAEFEHAKASIYSVSGRLVKTYTLHTRQLKINDGQIASGIYFAVLRNPGGAVKFIKFMVTR